MPTSSDEVGQVMERNLSRAFGSLVRFLWKRYQQDRAAESGIVEEAAQASSPDNPYAILSFKEPETAQRAAEVLSDSTDWLPDGAGGGLVAVRDEFVAIPKSGLEAAGMILDREGIPFAVAFEEVTMDMAREKVAGPEWDAVTFTDDLTGAPLEPELMDRVASVISREEINFERASNVLVFHAADRERILEAVDRAMGRTVTFEDLARTTRLHALRGDATDRQLAYIDALAADGLISDEALANFSLAPTRQAAHDLITFVKGADGWMEHGASAAAAAEHTAVLGEAGPQIARDSQAAQRREDIGNVETTAEHVQARPNAGDQDRSTPYPDQCDAPGSGDSNGNGVRDAAEDRDGDGETDDVDTDSNPPVEEFAARKDAEAKARESMPKNPGRDVSLQVETR